MTVTLQHAFDTKKMTAAGVSDTQLALDTFNMQVANGQPKLVNALNQAKAADASADALLLAAASALPNDTVAETSTGEEILVIAGALHVLKKVSADSISVDDGAPAAAAP